MYPLAVEATDLYEGARRRIAAWLGSTPEETIFTANATAAINLVAYTWGRQNVQRGDLVVLTEMEHHSNIVPWQLLCQDREAELAYVPVLEDGQLDLDALDALLARGPKLVAVVHVSNVLGTINPVAEIARRAHAAGADRAGRRDAGGAADAGRPARRSTSTSTPGPATRRTGRPGSACCTAGARCSRRCRRSSAAAT